MVVTNLIIAIAGASLRLTPVCTLPIDQFTASVEGRTPPKDPAAYYQRTPASLLFNKPETARGPDKDGAKLCLALEILAPDRAQYVRGAEMQLLGFNCRYSPYDLINTPVNSVSWVFDEVVPASEELRKEFPNATRMRFRWSVGLNGHVLISGFDPIEDEPAPSSAPEGNCNG